MRLRPYVPSDHAGCVEVLRSNVPEFALPHEVDEYAEWLSRATTRGEVDYFVHAPHGTVLACGGTARAATAPVATLCWGLVRHDLHGRGLGRALLAARLARVSEEPGIDVVLMDTTARALGFFTAAGFRVTGRVPDGYGPGVDRFDLELRLDGPTRARWRAAVEESFRPGP